MNVRINQLTYPLNDRQHRFPMPAGGMFSTATDLSKFCQMILDGGTLNGMRYLSPTSLRMMTSVQNGGAFNNAMDIDTTTGRIFIFMVQQDGPWGTSRGDAMIPTLERLADDLVSYPTF